MGFKSGAYAKVWELNDKDGKLSARMSISHKNKEGKYVQTWSGYAYVYGDAIEPFATAGEGGRVKLGDVDVTNHYDKEKKTTTTSYYIYTAEVASAAIPKTGQAIADFISVPDDLPDDGLPFR